MKKTIQCDYCGQKWNSDLGYFATRCPECQKSVCGNCGGENAKRCTEVLCDAIMHDPCVRWLDGEPYCLACWRKRVAQIFSRTTRAEMLEASLAIVNADAARRATR